jgi:hypothetical protein
MLRRHFLKASAAAALLAPERLLADPYAPLPGPRVNGQAVRVRGRVEALGRGLAGVAVSDGLNVVATDGDGRFELVTDGLREFVHVSVPAGYDIPRNPSGTARFYERVVAGAQREMSVRFQLQKSSRPDDKHTALFLADVQTQDAQEMQWFHQQTVPDVSAFVRASNESVFGFAVGDIMYDHLELYPEYERGVQRMGVPFFQVIGNHDLDFDAGTDEASTSTFSRHFGPRYYSFDRGAVHYIVMDDVLYHGAGYIGYLGADQQAWLQADLARVERGRPVILAMHIPVLGSRHERQGQRNPGPSLAVNNREALYRLLEGYRAHIITGHTHENEHIFHAGVHEHVSGTVCGAWWSGPICADGTPNGYSIYRVDGQTVSWSYKSTGESPDRQMRLYAAGSDARAPEEIVANIWDWDPEWQVTWYADGERRGRMARRVGFDPLSTRLHLGDDLPARRTWVDPYPTAHLFYAPMQPGVREVRVEARDRFGRVYSEVIKRQA